MMILKLNEAIELDILPSQAEEIDFRFLFSSDGSYFAAGKILNYNALNEIIDITIGSENWISEESEIFRFMPDGQFHSIILTLPANISFSDTPYRPQDSMLQTISLRNKSNFPFIVNRSTSAVFYKETKTIETFIDTTQNCGNRVCIAKGFFLKFNASGIYNGWILIDPLDQLAQSFSDVCDSIPADSATYNFIIEYWKTLSSENWEKFANNEEELIRNALQKLRPMTEEINSKIRKDIIEASLDDLESRFCET